MRLEGRPRKRFDSNHDSNPHEINLESTSRSLGERIEQLTDSALESFEQCPDQLSRLTRPVGQAVIGQISRSDLERELRVLGGQFLACVAIARAMDGPQGLEAPLLWRRPREYLPVLRLLAMGQSH